MSFTDVGIRIRDLRKERGLNQDELAELAQLNRVTIAKYEAGKVEPGAMALMRIANALETTTDELLGRKIEIFMDNDELGQIREELRHNPDMRVLFSAAKKASPEHLRAVANLLKQLEPPEDAE